MECSSRPKTEIMINGVTTVLCNTKELGGTKAVTIPTLMVSTFKQEVHVNGILGKKFMQQ